MRTVFSIVFAILITGNSLAQSAKDSVHLAFSQVLLLADTVIIPKGDTLVLLDSGTSHRVLTKSYFRSQNFYDSLKTRAYKNRVTKRIYKMLISYREPVDILKNTSAIQSESPFMDFEGKNINSIRFIHVDVFGGSVTDTSRRGDSDIERLGNNLHINTRDYVVRKNLLFDKGDTIDPFKLSDSERIVRRLPFIQDIRIIPRLRDTAVNDVDIDIIVRDRFPWSVNGGFASSKKYNLDMRNSNVAGFGNEIRASYLHYAGTDIVDGYSSTFSFRNLAESFVDLNINASRNYNMEYYGIYLSKNFLSPVQLYNGELYIDRIRQNIYPPDLDSALYFERNRLDLWLSRSFQISERQIVGIASRYVNHHHIRRPEVKPDSNEIYLNRQTVLGSLYLSRTNYYKSRNILSFNITEDIPVGFINAIVFGRNWSEFTDEYYAGFRLGSATYTNLGYFFGELQAGTFFSTRSNENSIFKFDASYFTPLFRLGNVHNRSFIRLNHFRSDDLSFPISTSLSDFNRIRDISGRPLSGNLLFSGSVESVYFLNYFLYGFQFAPFIYSDMGLVEESRIPESYSNFYNNLGLGFRIKNENLVFDAFEIRMSYFPRTPIDGDTFVFKFKFTRSVFFNSLNVTKPLILAFD